MNKTVVCVTAIGGGGFGEQILKSLQHVKNSYHIYGADIQASNSGVSLCHDFISLPPATNPDYIPTLLDFCKKKHVQAILPGSEAELAVLSLNRHFFTQENIFIPMCEHEVLTTCLDKQKLSDFLTKKGIHIPFSKLITCMEDIQDLVHYPFVFKPALGGGGSADVYIVQESTEAMLFCTYLLKNRGAFMAQEYVGTPECEYTVGVLTDMHGKHIQSTALKRNLQSALSRRLRVPNHTKRKDLGPWLVISSGISQGEAGQWPEICAQCEDIAKALGACGPFNLQGRMVDGKFMLFEINPRFSGTSNMRALLGMNEADLLIRHHVLGEEIPRNITLKNKTILRRLEEVVIPS